MTSKFSVRVFFARPIVSLGFPADMKLRDLMRVFGFARGRVFM